MPELYSLSCFDSTKKPPFLRGGGQVGLPIKNVDGSPTQSRTCQLRGDLGLSGSGAVTRLGQGFFKIK